MQIPEQIISFLQDRTAELYATVGRIPNYDMTPVFFVGRNVDDVPMVAEIILIDNVHPAEALPEICAKRKPDFGVLIFPAWSKDIAGNRIGEVVVMIAETPDSTEGYLAKITRDDKEVAQLQEFEKGDSHYGRLTNFINRNMPSKQFIEGPNTRQ